MVDRYVGWQVLLATIMGVVVLSVVVVLGQIFKEVFELLVEKDLPLDAVFKFIAFILPFSLTFTIPWGFLTAVLLIYGRLSADNELVSLRMAGLSMPGICRAVFIISIVLSGISLWINNEVAPRASAEMKDAMYEMAVDDPLALFQSDKIIDVGEYTFYSKERIEDRLKGVSVIKYDKFKYPILYLNADWASMEYDKATDSIIMSFSGMMTLEKGEGINRKTLSQVNPGVASDEWNLEFSLEALREDESKVKVSTRTTDFLINELRTKEDLDERERSRYRTEIHKRFSFSMASITFAFIGISLGITAQRRETSIGFALSLIIAISYFLFIIVADSQKSSPDVFPHILMWLPNVIFLGLGGFLFWRLSRK
ncbi:MAG: LptF/LptG family permease [Verrucomicrobiota bacterium]